jgi:hypothetical protein
MYVSELSELTPDNTGAHIAFVFENGGNVVIAQQAANLSLAHECSTGSGGSSGTHRSVDTIETCKGYCVAPLYVNDTVPPAGATIPAWVGCTFFYSRKTSENLNTDGFSCATICGKNRQTDPDPVTGTTFGLAGFKVTPIFGTGWNPASFEGSLADRRGVMLPEHVPTYGSATSEDPKSTTWDEFEPMPFFWRLIADTAQFRGWNVTEASWGTGNAANEIRTIEEGSCKPDVGRQMCGRVGEYQVAPHALVLDTSVPMWEWYMQRGFTGYLTCGIMYGAALITDIISTIWVIREG